MSHVCTIHPCEGQRGSVLCDKINGGMHAYSLEPSIQLAIQDIFELLSTTSTVQC